MQQSEAQRATNPDQGGPRGRSRRRLGAQAVALAGAPLRPGPMPVGWRERQRPGPQNPRKSKSRGEFDTGTPRGGSIGLMRSAREGRPIVGKRTAAAPVSNPSLCRYGSCGLPPRWEIKLRGTEAGRFTVKNKLTVKRRAVSSAYLI